MGGGGGGGGGGEPERACVVDLMFCHGTQIMDNRICCPMSMVGKTSCSHLTCQGIYYATYMLGLNFTINLKS